MLQDPESDRAAAELYHLAQTWTLLDAFQTGRLDDVHYKNGYVFPSAEAAEAVERARPELVALARRSDPLGEVVQLAFKFLKETSWPR